MAYPEPPTGSPDKGIKGLPYPAPQAGPVTLGPKIDSGEAGQFQYPQPNSAGVPSAPPGVVPGPEAYRPNIAGNDLGATAGTPGVTNSGNAGDGAKN